jgi:hypothetical protein
MKYVTEPDPSASCCSILDQNLRNHWENFVRTAARHGLRPDPPHETVDLRLSDAGHVVVFGLRGPEGPAVVHVNAVDDTMRVGDLGWLQKLDYEGRSTPRMDVRYYYPEGGAAEWDLELRPHHPVAIFTSSGAVSQISVSGNVGSPTLSLLHGTDAVTILDLLPTPVAAAGSKSATGNVFLISGSGPLGVRLSAEGPQSALAREFRLAAVLILLGLAATFFNPFTAQRDRYALTGAGHAYAEVDELEAADEVRALRLDADEDDFDEARASMIDSLVKLRPAMEDCSVVEADEPDGPLMGTHREFELTRGGAGGLSARNDDSPRG